MPPTLKNQAAVGLSTSSTKPSCIALTVPFLAHEDFTKHCQQWLRTTIQQHKHLTIPLHLPYAKQRTKLYDPNYTITARGKTPSIPRQIQQTSPARAIIFEPYCRTPTHPLPTAITFSHLINFACPHTSASSSTLT